MINEGARTYDVSGRAAVIRRRARRNSETWEGKPTMKTPDVMAPGSAQASATLRAGWFPSA
ncbi:hypothetical protein [Streptomyces sp. NPDC021224]|uniref:hypothetical protein n=1 Tax=unclassified Streptomyces TaxID=2593676 RepID=UPI00379F4663